MHSAAAVGEVPNAAGGHAVLPSDVMPGISAEQTQVDTPRQQGSTMPGDGSEVHVEQERSKGLSGTFNPNIPFKERAVGGAQKVRGTILRDHELKEHGQAILDGRISHEEEKKRKQD